MSNVTAPAVSRVENTWAMDLNDEGRVVLRLRTRFFYGGGEAGRSVCVAGLLPEPFGSTLWDDVHREQGVCIEDVLTDGARVPGLAPPLTLKSAPRTEGGVP